MQNNAQGLELAIAARPLDRVADDERWPRPVATLFIVSSSVGLWTGIYLLARLVFG